MTDHLGEGEAAGSMTADAHGQTYQIVLRGEIGERFSVLFEGMLLEPSQGTTVVTGPVRDQAHLHGLIERVQELGIELVSVNPLDDPRPGRSD